MNLVVVAACALIDVDGRVLITQRPEGKSMAGLWEFPGGKVERGETPETALVRGMDFASWLVSRGRLGLLERSGIVR